MPVRGGALSQGLERAGRFLGEDAEVPGEGRQRGKTCDTRSNKEELFKIRLVSWADPEVKPVRALQWSLSGVEDLLAYLDFQLDPFVTQEGVLNFVTWLEG